MDAQQGNGLTLEGLAQKLETLQQENAERLETLERENERMRSENDELRSKVDTLEGSDTRGGGPAETRSLIPRRDGESVPEFDGQVSRRSLLSKAGAAAVAAMAAGTLLYPRQARADVRAFDKLYANELHVAELAEARNFRGVANTVSSAAVFGENRGSGPGVTGYNGNANGTGVRGVTNNADGRAGVRGEGRIGVSGFSPNDQQAGVKGEGSTGVWGLSSRGGYSGVYGEHTGTFGHGAVGIGKGGSAGVLGRNPRGEGVRGEGATGVWGEGVIGVRGKSTTVGEAGVYAEHRVTDGPGVVADGSGPDYAGVLGRNGTGTGVWGQSHRSWYAGVHGEQTGINGYGVVGDGKGNGAAGVLGRNPGGSGVRGESTVGYGGHFEGGKAQLRLVPGDSVGKPSTETHSQGEIYMDSEGTLWVCTAGNGTTVGTWKKVTMTTVVD